MKRRDEEFRKVLGYIPRMKSGYGTQSQMERSRDDISNVLPAEIAAGNKSR